MSDVSDIEFEGASDVEISDAESLREDLDSDYEDDERVISPGHEAVCAKYCYGDGPCQWLSTPPSSVDPTVDFKPDDELLCAASEENELFSAFMSPAIVDMIVKHTNDETSRLKKISTRDDKSTVFLPTNATEILALFGLWIDLGLCNFSSVPLDWLFSLEPGSGSDNARLTFSRNRYKVLMRTLRFDDKSRRHNADEDPTQRKLRPVRDMIEKFMENCREQHAPGEFLTVDETLLGFRGRCSFRMFIPSKAEKYGLKIWTCVDAQTKYLYNARVYLGKGDMASGEEICRGKPYKRVDEQGPGYRM